MLWVIGLSLFILWLLRIFGWLYGWWNQLVCLLAVAVVVVPIDILQGQR